MRSWLFWPLFTCCWLLRSIPVTAQTNDVVVITDTDNPYEPLSVDGALGIHIDSTRLQTLINLPKRAFQPVGHMVPNAGYTGVTAQPNAIWLQFRLQNATRRSVQLYAKVGFWCFDSLQLFVTNSANDSLLVTSPVLGWRTPVEARPVLNRSYFFPMNVPGEADYTVYLRVLKQRGTQIIPLSLMHEKAYASYVQRDYLFWGGVLFSLLFVSLISLFFFITTRDSIYWSYALCVLCLIGFFFINEGFLSQFAFNAQFWLPRQNIYFLFPLLLFYSQLIFIRTFLPLWRTRVRWLHRLSTAGLLAGLLCILMLLGERWVTYPAWLEMVFSRLFTVLYWLPMPIIGAFVVYSIGWRHYAAAGWLYLVAVSPFYVLNFGQVLANFDLLPTYEPLVNFNYYALAAMFELLALTFGLAYRYKLMRDRTDRLLFSQREQERTSYVSEVQSLALRNSMLEEKERIARDLHDNVGAQLAFMITSLLHISRQAEHVLVPNGKPPGNHAPRLADELRTVVGYAREAIRTLRETIWAIHQERFTLDEFEERLNQYVNRYVQQTNGLDVEVLIDGDPVESLTSVQVLNFFRIVQEALSNVVKHAAATQATVRLITHPDGTFHLTIHDNGRGLNQIDKHPDDHHYGIHNMRRRAEELGAQFRIYDLNGTVVDVVRRGLNDD